jgi:hypothetical protein
MLRFSSVLSCFIIVGLQKKLIILLKCCDKSLERYCFIKLSKPRYILELRGELQALMMRRFAAKEALEFMWSCLMSAVFKFNENGGDGQFEAPGLSMPVTTDTGYCYYY